MSDAPNNGIRKYFIVAPEQLCCALGLPTMLTLAIHDYGKQRAIMCPHCRNVIAIDYLENSITIARPPDYYNEPIKCLGLSTRTHNALVRHKILIIGDLKCLFSYDDNWRTIRNFGYTALEETKRALAKYEASK